MWLIILEALHTSYLSQLHLTSQINISLTLDNESDMSTSVSLEDDLIIGLEELQLQVLDD
jgi:hypothetical protein